MLQTGYITPIILLIISTTEVDVIIATVAAKIYLSVEQHNNVTSNVRQK